MNKEELIKKLKSQGFSSKIVSAFEKIRREDFISKELKKYAYEDEPLPIGYGATISQPYTIAFMLNLLELKDRLKILEVGSGSGYVLALMNELSKNSEIYGIERIEELVEKSRKILKKNIHVIHNDGYFGLKEKAPFDRILVSASADEIPKNLIEQLNNDGILVCPIKNSIFKIKKEKNKINKKEYEGFIFVPLVKGELLSRVKS